MKISRSTAALAFLCVPFEHGSATDAFDFALHASDVRSNEPIARRHLSSRADCAGTNLSPALRWRGGPSGALSYAVTVVDRDAGDSPPRYHWIVVDIPPRSTGLPRGLEISSGAGGAVQLAVAPGEPGWVGPCAARGSTPHRYVFTVHALDVSTLPLPAGAGPKTAGELIWRHTRATATLTAIHPAWNAADPAPAGSVGP
jgi:Raf kinase inhibitor-like YbhB/YbcL family protein